MRRHNQLAKPDLIVMTGDYLSWDTAGQGEVVQALAGLRAPYGVFGSLGNHESITQTEESITRLFAAQGIHILRQERAPIQLNGETINLIGVDDSQSDDSWIDHLVIPDTVNILLTHVPVPAGFDWAVEQGFDLVLAGDSHGGHDGWRNAGTSVCALASARIRRKGGRSGGVPLDGRTVR